VPERPVTCNSAHLVLDARGRALDALPGLRGPGTFRRVPARAVEPSRSLEGVDEARRPDAVAAFHPDGLADLDRRWSEDLAAMGRAHADPRTLDEPAVWTAIAARHAHEARLAAAGLGLLRAEHGAVRVKTPAVSTGALEDPLLRVATRFHDDLAAGGVRNEQRTHVQPALTGVVVVARRMREVGVKRASEFPCEVRAVPIAQVVAAPRLGDRFHVDSPSGLGNALPKRRSYGLWRKAARGLDARTSRCAPGASARRRESGRVERDWPLRCSSPRALRGSAL
jgi:hypothetical protein